MFGVVIATKTNVMVEVGIAGASARLSKEFGDLLNAI